MSTHGGSFSQHIVEGFYFLWVFLCPLWQTLLCTRTNVTSVSMDRLICVLCDCFRYSAAEYCAPVWFRSPHTQQVNTQLNNTMQIITGTLRSRPVTWLPVLSNILPLNTRRTELTCKMLQKVKDSPHLPIHTNLQPSTCTSLISTSNLEGPSTH